LSPLATTTLSSNPINLPIIPDFVIVEIKPAAYNNIVDADFNFPIQQISVSFDNQVGLLSS
jgi:hypothetical protein